SPEIGGTAAAAGLNRLHNASLIDTKATVNPLEIKFFPLSFIAQAGNPVLRQRMVLFVRITLMHTISMSLLTTETQSHGAFVSKDIDIHSPVQGTAQQAKEGDAPFRFKRRVHECESQCIVLIHIHLWFQITFSPLTIAWITT